MIGVSKPFVTVLMSCYNSEMWLNDSIQSILSQTYSDFEFVIINDGSTDRSADILSAYAALDSRIVLLHQANSGLANALNRGIAIARGTWIARMDADDICEPTRLARQVAFAAQFPATVFVGTGLTIIDAQGALGPTFHYPRTHGPLLSHLRRALPFPPHSSAFYRREIVLEIGGYRGRVKRAEDWDLWLRLSDKGALASIPETLVRIRKHSGQVSMEGQGYDQFIDCRIAITSYFLRHFGMEDPLSDAVESNFLNYYSWVKSRFSEGDYFQYILWKDSVKIALERKKIFKIFLNFLLNPIYFYKLIIEKRYGDYGPYRAARKWLSLNKTCC